MHSLPARGVAPGVGTLHTLPRWHAARDVSLRACAAATAQRGAASLASEPCDRPDSDAIGDGAGPAAEPAEAAAPAASHLLKRRGLRAVPGIGPKNEELLLRRGHSGVDTLRQHFVREVNGDPAAMVSYLQRPTLPPHQAEMSDQPPKKGPILSQADVGIRSKSHSKAITEHLVELEGGEVAPARSAAAAERPGLTLCVEGNISSGKSTFLKILDRELVHLNERVEMVPEPVEQWQNVGGKGGNMLDQFYKDPARYAYTFQNYVFITRVMQEQDSRLREGGGGQRLIERSVFSDRMVFVRAVHNAKWMSELELAAYDSWFNPIVSALPSVVPDGFVYLRATPRTCHSRMTRRDRTEEGGVPVSYLEELHSHHEDWLHQEAYRFDKCQERLYTGNQDVSMVSSFSGFALPDAKELSDKIFFLDRKHQPFMHQAAHGIPALVLDYDQDIDLDADADAKAYYGKQVQAYFKWVGKLRQLRDEAKIVDGFMKELRLSRKLVLSPDEIQAELLNMRVRDEVEKEMRIRGQLEQVAKSYGGSLSSNGSYLSNGSDLNNGRFNLNGVGTGAYGQLQAAPA